MDNTSYRAFLDGIDPLQLLTTIQPCAIQLGAEPEEPEHWRARHARFVEGLVAERGIDTAREYVLGLQHDSIGLDRYYSHADDALSRNLVK
jgi:hypothetical protein